VKRPFRILVGAHVSIKDGIHNAPTRGASIGATAIQVFTKIPCQWREPAVTPATVKAFRESLAKHEIARVVAHDSYLINLASPDRVLSARSAMAFAEELKRCEGLGIESVVSHPGNYIDHPEAGLERNAARLTECLRLVPGCVNVALETTAGTGTSLGSSFQELARLRETVGSDVRHRVRFCADTCHLFAAGYDLRTRYDAVWREWDRVIGLDLLACIHLNDSRTPLGSRRDRHALLGEGSLGAGPFRWLMRDPRFRTIPKLIETPKGDDGVTNDKTMISRLRRWAASPVRAM
jgi:deoxyribonuclease-4